MAWIEGILPKPVRALADVWACPHREGSDKDRCMRPECMCRRETRAVMVALMVHATEATKDVGQAAMDDKCSDGSHMWTAYEVFRKMLQSEILLLEELREEQGGKA